MAISETDLPRKTSSSSSFKETTTSQDVSSSNNKDNHVTNNNMDPYNWMDPPGHGHDPIVTDTNFAEIDFEDFKNEDLAYAFSCGDEESGGSSTDMSICRSEALFSSMRDSASNNQQQPPDLMMPRSGMLRGAEMMRGSLIQDSLLDGADNLDFSEQIKVNKNHYTLTYSQSGNGASSLYGSNILDPASLVPIEIEENNLPIESPSSGKLTTWSNLGKSKSYNPQNQQQQEQSERLSRARHREENNINNNNNNTTTTNSNNTNNEDNNEGRKSKSLPDFGRSKNTKLVNNFMRNRDHRLSWEGGGGPDEPGEDGQEEQPVVQGAHGPIPMMRSKDTVNQYLKTAATAAMANAARLTSIEEAATESSSTTTPARSPLKPKRQQQQHKYPDLNFLENDVGLWDAFFLHSKNASKHHSVLKQHQQQMPLPVESYLQRQHTERGRGSLIQDSDSLRMLLPSSQQHLLPPPLTTTTSLGSSNKVTQSEPVNQVCHSMSKLTHDNTATTPNPPPRYTNSHDMQNEAIKLLFCNKEGQQQQEQRPVQMVTVKEAWAEVPEKETAVVRRRKKEENLINNNNNNNGNEEESLRGDEMANKRRSFHPQDHLSKVLELNQMRSNGRNRKKRADFPKSGSQNDICDTFTPEEEQEEQQRQQGQRQQQKQQYPLYPHQQQQQQRSHLTSAEYPFFQMNLCSQQPQGGINFDLTRKRGLFVNLYSAVERLLMYQDGTPSSTPNTPMMGSGSSSSTSIRCILFREFCPALHAILEDGLKPEVITSFGKMTSSVWRMIEALTRQGPSASNSTCDLVMLINSKFAANGEDERKFAGFVAGLLNMSSLHIWFSKLKWSLDVLLRFYERHAFVCSLHKETKLLFDELLFCLQRLYSIPFRVDMPFSMDLLEHVPDYYHEHQLHQQQHQSGCPSCRTSCAGSPLSEASRTATSPGFSSGRSSSTNRSPSGKSRIPRPISLPKRLESKLGASPSPVRSNKMIKGPLGPTVDSSGKKTVTTTATTSSANRKSRVRDTVRLFDSSKRGGGKPPIPMRPMSGTRQLISMRSPVCGAGEAMALEDSNGSRGNSAASSGR